MTIAISPQTPVAGCAPASAPVGPLPVPPALASTSDIAVFLDFDGTLVEIADHPADVIVPSGIAQTLTGLSRRLDGRLAIVSGRSLAVLDELLGAPAVAMAGSHGGEFRPVGTASVEALADPLPRPVCEALSDYARDNGGLVFEAKPFSAAIHYRDRPDAAEKLIAYAAELAASRDLVIKHGKMVVEVTMPGSDKGNAVRRFMAMAPFAQSRPLFLGDDVTDEDAFAAVTPFGGGGILVGPMRQTQALWRLADVTAVHDWLEAAT